MAVTPLTRRVLVAHGAGSSPAVAVAAFGGPPATSFWLAGHGPAPAGDPGGDDRALAEALASSRPEVLAGISYGAHLAARRAADGLPPGVGRLALVMPAWTGAPGAVAAATLAQADTFERVGVAAELARIVAAYPGWVADALSASWPGHDPARLVPALRRLARSPGPTPAELARITVPTTVVALADDPLHPVDVARRWAATIPRARLVVIRAQQLADLGIAALSQPG